MKLEDCENEFDRVFNDVFERRAGTYKKIVKSLVSGSKTLSEISAETARIKRDTVDKTGFNL